MISENASSWWAWIQKAVKLQERSLDELAELAATAGAEVTGRLIQTRECVHPATYIGRGKLIELKELLWETEATGSSVMMN